MTEPSHDPPFGAYGLSSGREWLRRQTRLLPDGRLGRIGASLVRRALIGDGRAPVDVEVFPSIRARLYPATNRCEKRAVVAEQFFDPAERDFIAKRVAGAAHAPFVVVDLGANVGLYGLSAVAAARNAGKPVRVLAVEPDVETRRRLERNVAFSGARELFVVVPCGVGGRKSSGVLAGHATNRGQHRVVDGREGFTADAAGGPQIEIVPLFDICLAHGVERIDVLKIDVEGFDFDVIEAFVASAPRALWPDAIIVEVGREASEAPVVRLLREHGYVLAERTKLNAIMVAQSNTKRQA